MILKRCVIYLGILLLLHFYFFDIYPIQSEGNIWGSVSPLRVPRFEISVADLDGKINAVGGVDKDEYTTRVVEIYEATDDT